MRHLQLDPLILYRHLVLAGLHSHNLVLASFGSLLISPVVSSFPFSLWYLLVFGSSMLRLALSLHSSPMCLHDHFQLGPVCNY